MQKAYLHQNLSLKKDDESHTQYRYSSILQKKIINTVDKQVMCAYFVGI